MQFNRTKNTTRTFIFGVISKLITIIFPFVTRTIIIYKLGAEYVGLTSLFTSVLSILNISELGISSAIAFCLYKPIAEDDKATINALMGVMRKLYKFIGAFMLIAGICVMPFLDKLISGSYPESMNIYILYVIYLLNSAVSYLGFAYKGVLFEAYQQGDVNHKILSVTEIIKYILQIFVLLLFANYYWYAALLPVSTIVVTLVTEYVSRKKHPDIVPGGTVPEETRKTIKKKVAFLSAHSIASTLTNSIDNIVISGSLGLFVTAVYGNYAYIYSAVIGFVTLAIRSVKPAIGNSLYTNSKEEQKFLFRAVQLATAWGAMWCSACLLCLYQPFIELWVGEQYLVNVVTLVMIILYFYGNTIKLSLSGTYIDARGLWNKTLFRQITVAVLNLVLDILLVKRFGIAGIVFASFFATTVVALPMDLIVIYKYVFGESPLHGFLITIKNFVIAVIICGVTYLICDTINKNQLITLILRFLICLIIPNLIMLLIYRKKKEFAFIKSHIKALIAR